MSGTYEGSQKRKAMAISRIIEDRQVDYDEAEEIYKERFRLLGSKGGKNKTGLTGFQLMTPEKRKEAGARGGKASRRRKNDTK